MPDQALSDAKVIDLSHHVAGPYCAKLLADYGAEVVKIENPDGGDPARRLGPFPGDIPHPEKSGTFLHLNTNKKGITLNLKTATGKEILKRLVRDADILVESFEPRVMPSLGLSYESLKEVNPKLVMTSISNFGQWGPYRDYKATDFILYGWGGPLLYTGNEEREPIKTYWRINEYLVGTAAIPATLAALYLAQSEGIGQQVDLAIVEVMAGMIDRRAPGLIAYSYSGGHRFLRTLERATSILPLGVYPCQDGYIVFVISQRFWNRFCRWIERPDMLEDPQFATQEQRLQRDTQGLIEAIFLPWALDHTKAEIMASSMKYEIPCTAIYTPGDVVSDPHFLEREFFVEIEHPVAGKFKYPGSPFRPQETPWKAGRAPLLGEHNEEIYCGRLGYSHQDLVLLRERGII